MNSISMKFNIFDSFKGQSKSTASKKIVITPNIQQVIDLYRQDTKNKGTLTDTEIAVRYNILNDIYKQDEDAVLKSFKNAINILTFEETEKYKQIFDIFEAKWDFEKAKGLLSRNPSLFNVPTSGYGSAEVAGEETMVLSYVIDVTRPLGKPLLAILFLLLLKPFVFGL